MRGKVQSAPKEITKNRITPAYAGKSSPIVKSIAKLKDHPRLCGEKYDPDNEFDEEYGSPPPMRGKVPTPFPTCEQIRITPAYAGKSNVGMINIRSEGDHPRLCGEKFTARNRSPDMTGSPPPMRGKDKSGAVISRLVRITPAYAGKSEMKSSPISSPIGSPPPMRGKVSEKPPFAML